METKEILEKVKTGELSVEDAEQFFKKSAFEELGYAKLDTNREIRSGFQEAIYCQGKADDHLVGIVRKLYDVQGEVFGTRASIHQYELLKNEFPELEYDPLSHIIKIEKENLVSIDQINKYNNDQIVIITTGSQGEPMSALARMATSEHRKVNIVPGDTIIISATPIPGNEKLVSRVIDQLFKKGAEVVYGSSEAVHVSGHACQEELKLMQTLVRPKYFIPVHGEYRHLKQHGELANSIGVPKSNILIPEIGDVIEVTRNSIKKSGTVISGQIFVDGLGVGDVGNIVIRDRKHLSQDGILTVVVTLSKENKAIIAGPDIISRGFVYVRESEKLMDEARDIVRDVFTKCEERKITDWSTLKSTVRDELKSFLYEKTKRKPMILPIIMEI